MELEILRSRLEMTKQGIGKTGEIFEFNYNSDNNVAPYNVSTNIFKEGEGGIREHIATVVVYTMNDNVELTIRKATSNKYALAEEAEQQARLIISEFELPDSGEHSSVL